MPSSKKKIFLYRTSTCGRCEKASKVLKAVLKERGLAYSDTVEEKFIDRDESARKELEKIKIMSAPTIRIGNKVLVEDEPTLQEYVLQFLQDNGF